MQGSEPKHYVTLAELDHKLDALEAKVPSRWEVRFLIVAGLIAAQLIPVNEAAQAAIGLFS